MLGSGSDPSVIFEAGIWILAVLGAAGIKLVVSRRIQAELRTQDVYFYFFNPMWKIRKYQVQGTQRFWEDVDQIVKVSTRQSSLSGAPGLCVDHEWQYVHHSFHVHVQIYHP